METFLAPLIPLGEILFLLACIVAALWLCMQVWNRTTRVHALLAIWILLALGVISIFAFFGSLWDIPVFGAGVGVLVFIGLAAYTGTNYFSNKDST